MWYLLARVNAQGVVDSVGIFSEETPTTSSRNSGVWLTLVECDGAYRHVLPQFRAWIEGYRPLIPWVVDKLRPENARELGF